MILINTVESSEFVVAKFSWYSWVALPQQFTSSMNTYVLRLNSFLLQRKTDASTKLHPQE